MHVTVIVFIPIHMIEMSFAQLYAESAFSVKPCFTLQLTALNTGLLFS